MPEQEPYLTSRLQRVGRDAYIASIKSFSGRHNVRNRWELGKEQLWTATNVDITDSNKIRRRMLGQERAVTGKWRSVYGSRWMNLGVQDGNLMLINNDLTVQTLRENVGDVDMCYAPANDIVAYNNGLVTGYVKDKVSYLFPNPTDRYKLPIPVGNLIEYWNDRLYIVIGRIFFWSDSLSKRFGAIDKRKNGKQMASDITLFKAVNDGVYISDSEAIYFANGLDAIEWTQPGRFRKVLDSPARYNAWCEIDGSVLAEPTSGKVLAIATVDGICIATNSGVIRNVTRRDYVMPDAQRTAMLFVKQQNMNRVITAIPY